MTRRERSGPAARLRRARPGQEGFTLVEVMVAMTIFSVLLVSFGLLFSSSLRAYRFARARTMADQIGSGEIEKARNLSWDNLGTVSGNPPGNLVASETVTVGNTSYGVTRKVILIDDPVPQGISTGANYKRVVITVSSPAMTAPLQYETIVAPPTQPSLFTGVVRAKVLDTYNNTLANVAVTITGGPSPTTTRSDVTDAYGEVVFAALKPTDTSGAGMYYDVTPTYSGWQVHPADVAVGHITLNPGETSKPTFRMFKPVRLTVQMVDASGVNPVTSPVSLTITDLAAGTMTQSFTSADGTQVLTTFGSGSFIPNQKYSFSGTSYGYTTASPMEFTLNPVGYPTTVDATVTVMIPIPARVPTTFHVRDSVTLAAMPNVSGTVTGGPDGAKTFTSDASGLVSLSLLPASYTVTVSPTPTGYFPYTSPLSITTQTSIDTNLDVVPLPAPVNMTLTAKNSATAAVVPNATLVLSGGPSGTLTVPTGPTGTTTVSIRPGSYTANVSPTPTGYQAYSPSTLTVGTSDGSATISLNPYGAVSVTTRDSVTSAALGNVTVTLSGGPSGTVNVPTNASGTASTYVIPGTYNVSVASPPTGYAPYAGTLTVPATGATLDVPLVKYGVIAFTTASATNGTALSSVNVTLSGGPSGTVTFTTNGSGLGSATLLPGTYTLSASKSGYTYSNPTFVVVGGNSSQTVYLVQPSTNQTIKTKKGSLTSATVTLTGFPGTFTFTTNGSGSASVPLPPGLYTVSIAGAATVSPTTITAPSGSTSTFTITFT